MDTAAPIDPDNATGPERRIESKAKSEDRRPPGRPPWLAPTLLVTLLDALLTGPFVFHEAAEAETLRYVLSIHRWRAGMLALHQLFNAEQSYGYYALARASAAVLGLDLSRLPALLNHLSWAAGVLASGLLHLLFRRWLGPRIALRLSLLLVFTPGFWALHVWGQPNICGLAVAAAALAMLPGADDTGRTSRTRLGLAAGLSFLAFTLRADILFLLAPAILARVLWGRDRIKLWAAVVTGGAGVAACDLLRLLALGVFAHGGTIGLNVRSNLDLGSLDWPLQNLMIISSTGPPLVFVASLAAFAGCRGEGGSRMRKTVLLWGLPVAAFLPFARVDLTRILVPVLPGLLLPLAVWAAQGRRRRDAALAGLVLAAHLSMLAVPHLLDRAGKRSLATSRSGHGLFVGNVFADHGRVRRQAIESAEDAAAATAALVMTPSPPLLVVGEDEVFFEYAFSGQWPRSTCPPIAETYGLVLHEFRTADGAVPAYLLERRTKEPVSALLDRLSFRKPVRVWRSHLDRRLYPGDGS